LPLLLLLLLLLSHFIAGAVDLGAMWIHEAGPGNAVYDLTRRLGINISQPHNYRSASLFNPDGTPGSLMNYVVRHFTFYVRYFGRALGLLSIIWPCHGHSVNLITELSQGRS
jgi:hypothetical protein